MFSLVFQTFQDLIQRQQVETEEVQNELDQTEIQEIEKQNNVSRFDVDRFKETCFCICSKYSKTYLKQPLKNRQNKDLNDKW